MANPRFSFALCLRHAFMAGAGYGDLERISDEDQRRYVEYDPPQVGSFATMEKLISSTESKNMKEHEGLPVAGYKKQSDENVQLVNENKILEEKCLRQLDKMNAYNMAQESAGIGRGGQHDPRMMALARTGIQEAFMWMNRAVFKPERIELPDVTDIPVKTLDDLKSQYEQVQAERKAGEIDDYHRGYYNGIILAHATVFGHEPDFIA